MATKPKEDDLGQAEVQQERDEAAEKGHVGVKYSDNAPYTLRTGPESPSAFEANIAAAEKRAETLRGR